MTKPQWIFTGAPQANQPNNIHARPEGGPHDYRNILATIQSLGESDISITAFKYTLDAFVKSFPYSQDHSISSSHRLLVSLYSVLLDKTHIAGAKSRILRKGEPVIFSFSPEWVCQSSSIRRHEPEQQNTLVHSWAAGKWFHPQTDAWTLWAWS